MKLERKHIQGLVVSSYKHLPCAAFFLLKVADSRKARLWIHQHLAEVTVSEGKNHECSTNLAFTYDGLKALGLKESVLASFSVPFQEGMASEYRSRILGDVDENMPSKWEWGSTRTKQIDALLLVYGRTDATTKALVEARRAEMVGGGAFEEVSVLGAERQPNTNEHFGFNDGIGQPVMEGTGNKTRQRKRTHHATELRAGEFLIGHLNVYNVIADGPVVPADDDRNNLLVAISKGSNRLNSQVGLHDLGLNGTYLVFRQLAQDVARFWNFLDHATCDPSGRSNVAARERLAAKFVGRWRSGAPLVLSPHNDDSTLMSENNFAYAAADPDGMACPIGSHIRRTNPRDSLGPDRSTALNSANRHRILRRGRSYGPRISDHMVDDGKKRGLLFICLNADIERQFEFVQQTWMNNPVFGGLDGEVDPLVGNLPKGDCVFTVPDHPLRRRVHNLSRFVSVKGGAYFFLPSIRALKYLANL
jgi:Dyp-type peroxidase family